MVRISLIVSRSLSKNYFLIYFERLGFTDFIRIKYDIFEKLPNLDHVDILDGKSSSEQHFLGKYCENSRLIFTRCIEPNPDISSCLIHQKMQVRQDTQKLELFQLTYLFRSGFQCLYGNNGDN